MPYDDAERTEAPTSRRRSEARERGQVARSTDLTAALVLLCSMIFLRILGPRTLGAMLEILRNHLAMTAADAKELDVQSIVIQTGLGALSATGPLLAIVLLIALSSNLVQVGFVFTTHPLEPNLDKLNPVTGAKRLLNMRMIVQLGMNLCKLGLVGFVTYLLMRSRLDEVMLAMQVETWPLVVLTSTVLYEVGLYLAAVLFVLALLDYAWQRWRFERDLRMTKEEVKEEMRRMEGDPLVKQRRRRMQFAATLQKIRSAVPKADVVVTNPTELAVAIQYDSAKMQAPVVVAKGRDYIAQKIREIAIAEGVPIVERKPLAQALFKSVEVGQEVPERFYKAVAEVLAYVYQLSGKAA